VEVPVILQIRATSGGGKTTVMRHIFAEAGCKPVKKQKTKRGEKVLINKGKLGAYPLYIIGPYDSEGTGGCDRISKIEEVIALVDEVAAPSNDSKGDHKAIVCFEGLLLAHSWGQMGEFLHEKYGDRYMNAFIDTSVEQCYKNVLKRRKASGADNTDKERLEKIHKNVVADHHRVALAHNRVIARGGRLIDVPYKTAPQFVLEYLHDWIDIQEVLYR
jgi:hypothetical protein